MHISRALFKLSDIFHAPLRNYRRYPAVVKEKNISYGDDKRYNLLDVYYAPSKKKGSYPVLFNIHGGGFVRGGKGYRSGIAARFADKGWFVVNIDYRLYPNGFFPCAPEDAMNALNFVGGLKDKYDLDLSKIVITGDSAGGYYAAFLVACIYSDKLRESLALPEYTGQKPRALLTFCAPFDVIKCFTAPTPFDITVDVTNLVFGTNYRDNRIPADFPYADEQVNVLKNVTPDWCECFSVVAQNDSFCGGQLEGFNSALDKCGIKHGEFTARARGDSHCSHLLPFKRGTPATLEAVDRFLDGIKND